MKRIRLKKKYFQDKNSRKRYNVSTMYNWSTDTSKLKENPEKYNIWRLEQLINFGLGNEKLSRKELNKYWDRLDLDPKRKKVLEFWLK